MGSRFRQALLASVLGLGVMAGLVRADHHGQPPYYQHAQIYQPQALLTEPQQPARRHFLFHRTQAHPLGCWAHHNDPSCSSFKSTCTFVFGNCRTFFGEPCRKGPATFPY